MIDYEKIVFHISDYADEMNIHYTTDPEKGFNLLIGYIYGITEAAYMIKNNEGKEDEPRAGIN